MGACSAFRRDAWGQLRQSDRPETDWIRVAVPALRVITDDQWRSAHDRLHGIRESLRRASGGRVGVRRRDIDSAYLLPGFARCAACGGSLGVMSGTNGNGRRHVYGCTSYLKRGTSVCGNNLRLPLDRVDDAVLRTLAGDVLRPRVVMSVIDGVLEAMAPRQRAQELEQCHAALRKADIAIANLARAIAVAGDIAELLDELQGPEPSAIASSLPLGRLIGRTCSSLIATP